MAATNQPNEYGYAGGATTPEPGKAHPDADPGRTDAEHVAVPADDLTGALSGGIEDLAGPDDAPDTTSR